MNFVDQSSIRATSVMNGFAPLELPKALYIPLDFTNGPNGSDGAEIEIDLEQFEQEAHLTMIQNVFIDLTKAGCDFILTASLSQHSLTLKDTKQAYLPFLVPTKSKITANVSAPATGIIKIQLLNMPVPSLVW